MLSKHFPTTSAAERKLKDKIEREFNLISGNILVSGRTIYVWYGLSNGAIGGYWTGSPSGAIHGQSAIDSCNWTVKHLEEFRSLLPKQCRDYEIRAQLFI